MDRQLLHPLHGSSGGTLYKMNNTTVTKGMEPQPIPSTIRLIEEDIWLPDSRQQMHRIQQGEEVRIMVMSGKTYVKRVKGNDQPILDATGTKYDPRTQPPPLIQLD
uniref:Uncharacterized protein n=1 Tax=Panagrolaimus sp. JU765 TaxID=591449 RepID=A0AC34RFF7_9BILA